MRIKIFILIVLIGLHSDYLWAQYSSESQSYSFSIKKVIVPPYIEFVSQPVYVEHDNNNTINALERSWIKFSIKNTGKGDAMNLRAKLTTNKPKDMYGLFFKEEKSIDKIITNNKEIYTDSIEITSNINTIDGKIDFQLVILEPNGFNSDAYTLSLETRRFQEPKVVISDYNIVTNDKINTKLERKKFFTLKLLVQNQGQGKAEEINIKLDYPQPENVYSSFGQKPNVIHLNSLQPNEIKVVEFEMALNANYSLNEFPVKAIVSEKYNKYSFDWEFKFLLNQEISNNTIVFQAQEQQPVSIEKASFTSDVDKNIPFGLKSSSNKYALIIGCEDYSSFQKGLQVESNCDFAINDAKVFSDYAITTLGYPKDQVNFISNPTSSSIKRELQKIYKFIELEKSNAEILIYYSGHGLPDPITNKPYLIPVDVNGAIPSDGISLFDLYKDLTKLPSKQITIILDACFSGGARNKELVAMKGVKITPKVDFIPSNIVVLSSCSGIQTSSVYKEKQHGYFTYFLLKNLQQTKALNSIVETMAEVKYKVSKEALKNSILQDPELLIGENFENINTIKW